MANIYGSIVSSVLLYGAEAWALSKKQTERLEVFQRSCIRNCSPRTTPVRGPDGVTRFRFPKPRFTLPAVQVQIERKQLRWLGHLARRDESRLPLIMLSANRRGGSHEQGRALFNHYLCGDGGVYDKLIKRCFTDANVKKYFSSIEFVARRPQWVDAAQHRKSWEEFAAGAPR